MSLMQGQKRQLFNSAIEIAKQAAGAGGQTSESLPDIIERVYEKLKAIAEKDEL